MLAAANALLADADAPHEVTMDDFAAAAGVGKGTLFRAFGSRDGLLDELWATRLADLRHAVENNQSTLNAATSATERVVAFLDALLTFKLDNRHLIRMREKNHAGIRQSQNYLWSHSWLRGLITDAAPATTTTNAGYAAHVLLGALDVSLIEDLVADGQSLDALRHTQAALARAVTDGTQTAGRC